MTASTEHSKTVPRSERRIIERPRLIKLLDESEARIILLLAPAGYGKTTLARQWFKTLNGAIWISLTPAHRDVARLAEELAIAVDRDPGGETARFIREYLRARENPQRASREVAMALVPRMRAARLNWCILDDFHHVADEDGANDVLNVLQEHTRARFLVTSRTRPNWASSRRVVYGEVAEVGRHELAMDDVESRAVLRGRTDAAPLIARAEGWPAVLALAASTRAAPPVDAVPSALYEFFAEELYQSISPAIQQQLLRLALIPELSDTVVRREFGQGGKEVMRFVRELGLTSLGDPDELHPLVRDFLIDKLRSTPDGPMLARRAVESCLAEQHWDRAFELILRFDLTEVADLAIAQSYRPLLRSGRLGTLASFAAELEVVGRFPPPPIDLVEAEVAMRDGHFELATALATRVRGRLPTTHGLISRASLIIGQSGFFAGDFERSAAAYRDARASAVDDEDVTEALYGLTVSAVQGELDGWDAGYAELAETQNENPLKLVRYATAMLARRRFPGLREAPALEAATRAVAQVEDPRVRSAFWYALSYDNALRGEYERALDAAVACSKEVNAYDLDFARAYNDWNIAFANLGLRRFAAAEAALQRVEDANRDRAIAFHVVNSHVLRIRLALVTGRMEDALQLARQRRRESRFVLPSLAAEETATRGLCFALAGQADSAFAASTEAESATRATEVALLAATTRAVAVAENGNDPDCVSLFATADGAGVWDPLLLGLRCSRALAEAAARTDELRPTLASLYQRSHDLALARRSGLRQRSLKPPSEVLSPRELEVLQLVAQGFRNREIANALVISESTAKVHVRHVLEKLGVRTRAEAVARYRLFN